ncbi:hypothetical protein HNQ59_003302 [Chitinivorax tropicus]|uniref:Uncharacterized protein n=1 Tax=Chitinivorax tropicus TaxID=714531 RepID=A0A840MLF8_9PROT|nr:hypothetical protein [Chitinivorax tropicus]
MMFLYEILHNKPQQQRFKARTKLRIFTNNINFKNTNQTTPNYVEILTSKSY